VITEVDQVPTNATSEDPVQLNLLADTAAACGGTKTSTANGLFSQDQPRELTFAPGIGISSGHYLDLDNGGLGFNGIDHVYGYTVAAAACTTSCL
jgi:hypothetical protein